jgi:hypothetical protein
MNAGLSFTQVGAIARKSMKGDLGFILFLSLFSFIGFQTIIVVSYSKLFSKWKQLHETNTPISADN